MPKFKYKARDERGSYHENIIISENLDLAKTQLMDRGLWVLEISQQKDESQSILYLELDYYLAKLGLGGVGLKDQVIFCRQFSTLINSGVAVVRSLGILSAQLENKYFARILGEVKTSVEQGANLSDAFAAYPDIFDKLFVSMIKAGETGGVLDVVLNRIAKFMEDRARLSSKIKSAMTYPVVVAVVATIIFFVMLTVILPKFSQIFSRLGTDLPAYTRFLMDISNLLLGAMKFPWCIVLLVFFGSIFFGFKKLYSIEAGKYYIDKIFLRLPVFGNLLKKVAVARFTRTLGTLIKSGVPILTALEIVEESSGNAVLARAVKNVKENIKQGGSISSELEQQGIFPAMVVSMISVGEETGELDAMLSKIADFYDTEVEAAVEALTSLLEPLMMVFIGGIVGSVIVGMYLPMFKIFESIK